MEDIEKLFEKKEEETRFSGRKRSRENRDYYDQHEREYHRRKRRKTSPLDNETRRNIMKKEENFSGSSYSNLISAPTFTETESENESSQSKALRTLFIFHLKPTVREREIYEFFEHIGRVRDVKLIKDKKSGSSKGFGYVEFSDIPTTKKALGLHGQLLAGYPVFLKAQEADLAVQKQPTLQQRKTVIKKVFVCNFPDVVDEEDLRYLFESVGPVENVEIKSFSTSDGKMNSKLGDELGKYYAYVRYRYSDDALKALIRIHGAKIGMGKRLKVGLWDDRKINETLETLDEGNKGIKLTQQKRILLMHQIAGGVMMKEEKAKIESVQQKIEEEQSVVASMPTKNIVLKNMFILDSEKDFNLPGVEKNDFKDLLEDVSLEVKKFGNLENIIIDENSQQGEIYLRYQSIQSATNARQTLKGRPFDGRKIDVSFIEDEDFFKKMEELG